MPPGPAGRLPGRMGSKLSHPSSVSSPRTRGTNCSNWTLRMSISDATKYSAGGDPVIETTWHNVSAWEGRGMPSFDDIAKGGKIYVMGRLRSQRYTDADGIERTAYEVLAKRILLIEDVEPFSYEM